MQSAAVMTSYASAIRNYLVPVPGVISPERSVLCVDRDADVREMLTAIFSFEDIRADGAGTAHKALSLISRQHYALVITDTHLPVISGVDLCKLIRKRDRIIPVIFYSGADTAPDREAARAAGGNAYLVKPDIVDLLSTVRLFFSRTVE
jgi:DNA-binding response OmpR family regulator